MIKIKKAGDYIAYREQETIHTFIVNGKEVRISHWFKNGEECDENESNIEVLENSALTDEEYDALDPIEMIVMKAGDELNINEED